MDTIGSVDYERQPHFRQTLPTAALSDRDSDHGNSHDRDHDGHRGDNPPNSGTAPGRRVGGPQHMLNVTA